MIYCSHCNTANRDNSRFCNECGANLATAKRRCQVCGTLNAADLEACTNCGARLLLLADAEPEEEPEEAPSAPQIPARPLSISAPLQPPIPAADIIAPTDAEPPDSGALPEWLRELRGPSPAAPATNQPAMVSQSSNPLTPAAPAMPDWLNDIPPSQSEPVVPPMPPASNAPEAAAPEATSKEDLPAWLRELRSDVPIEAAVVDPALAVDAEAPLAEVPDWLADLSNPAAPAAMTTEPAQMAGPLQTTPLTDDKPDVLAAGEMPDWLKELADTQPVAPAAPTVPVTSDLSDVAVDELPAWLKPSDVTLHPTQGVVPVSPGVPPSPVAQPAGSVPAAPVAAGLAPAEMPSWITELRPGGRSALASEPIETSGLLAGVRGALPIEAVFVQPHKYVEYLPVAASLPMTGFAELHARNPAPPVDEEKPGKPRRFKWPWQLIISLIIVSAIATSFLQLPMISEARGSTIAAYQPSRDFYQTVNQFGPQQAQGLVLVAFEYSAGTRDELDMQARPVLRHLFENHQRIIAVSSLPEGGQLAQDMLNARNPVNTVFNYPYRYGETHINLGYISGGEASLRLLTQNQGGLAGVDFRDQRALNEWPIVNAWRTFDDIELVIVFTDDGLRLSHWVEQVSTQPGQPHKPILAGVGKSVETSAMPYYDSRQLNGLLAGIHGACEYENDLIEPHAAAACATLDAQGYAVLILIGVIALSLPGMLFIRKR